MSFANSTAYGFFLKCTIEDIGVLGNAWEGKKQGIHAIFTGPWGGALFPLVSLDPLGLRNSTTFTHNKMNHIIVKTVVTPQQMDRQTVNQT